MDNSFKVFCRTIQIGEKLLGLSFSDYRDAYDYSAQGFSSISEHMIEFFEDQSALEKGQYGFNVLRYFYIKAIEHRISSDLYAETTRGNVCDVFWSPFDAALESYPTNLPKHLEEIVNSRKKEATDLAKAVMREIEVGKGFYFGTEVLNAIQFLGQTIGYHIGKENSFYKGYPCSDMLTRNEMNEWAGVNFCKWLEKGGFIIENANFTRDTYQNVIAAKDDLKIYVLLSTEIAPENPHFIQVDLDNLYNSALEDGVVPYYASVSLGSADDKHFNDGVLLYGDQVRYKVNAFGELEAEEETEQDSTGSGRDSMELRGVSRRSGLIRVEYYMKKMRMPQKFHAHDLSCSQARAIIPREKNADAAKISWRSM